MLKVIREDGIDESFRIVNAPIYVVARHNGYKRCLSRSAALNNLAHFMVSKVFSVSGIPTEEPYEQVFVDGVLANKIGDKTQQYLSAHERCIRRLRRILAKKRAFNLWERKHEAFKQQYAELLSQKPY
ncbi:hypothetical protein CIG19_18815 [Enterobacterales bacterium CwR94]|nr:hypothetical protein CIG19_18815 [Enterobacterales bacterium CwR94]